MNREELKEVFLNALKELRECVLYEYECGAITKDAYDVFDAMADSYEERVSQE